jgi:hypothetical protein
MSTVWRRDDDVGCPSAVGAEGRMAALARELVDKVGVDGASRYCCSLGWRGVLQEVELLRREQVPADRSSTPQP